MKMTLREFTDMIMQLTPEERRLMLLFSYAMQDRKADADKFTLDEINATIETLNGLESQPDREFSYVDKIEWLQAIKAERENG